MGSGDDIESGRTTSGEDTTFLIGQRHDNGDDFGGDFVFIAGPDPGQLPGHQINGILGVGHDGLLVPDFPGGIGLIGQGGLRHGTGILGLGGGADVRGEGAGGIGAHGVGGNRPNIAFQEDAQEPPGAGILAQGGRQPNPDKSGANSDRKPHGPGLVAVAGGAGQPWPLFDYTGGAGVYAIGGDSETVVRTVDGKQTEIGPQDPGPGVVGAGGREQTGPPRRGPGVVGLSGDADRYGPPSDDTGVIGVGHVGLRAYGQHDRGAVFQANHEAQVQLEPRITDLPAPTATPVTPTALDMTESASALPKDGRVGDLLTLADPRTQAGRLWFCSRGLIGDEPAYWQEVLLGPAFQGRG